MEAIPKENDKLRDLNNEIWFQLDTEKIYNISKDEEIQNLRKKIYSSKMQLTHMEEGDSYLFKCSELLGSECKNKDKEIKQLKKQVNLRNLTIMPSLSIC